jgi:hypothetical protein
MGMRETKDDIVIARSWYVGRLFGSPSYDLDARVEMGLLIIWKYRDDRLLLGGLACTHIKKETLLGLPDLIGPQYYRL